MISTVTTTTVTVVSSTALGATLSFFAIIALVAILIQKELLSSAQGPQARALNALFNVVVIPLLLGFAFIVIVKTAAVLQ